MIRRVVAGLLVGVALAGGIALADGPFYDSVAGFIGTATADLDLDGTYSLITDADGDTYINSIATDDVIEFWTGGGRRARWKVDGLTVDGTGNIRLSDGRIYTTAGILPIGSTITTSHALGAGDVGIGGALEVDGLTYLDGATQVANTVQLQFGASASTNIAWNTAQTPDTLVWQSSTPEIKVRNGDAGTDFAFADPGYPVTAWQSSDQTNVNKRIWIGHDGTDGLLSSGVGHVSITPEAGKALEVTTGYLALNETTAPSSIAGVGQIYVTAADEAHLLTDGGDFVLGGAVPIFAYATHPASSSGSQYVMSLYDWPAADANLTDASPTVNHGAADNAHGSRAGLVASGPGSVDAGTVSIVVSGTSFDPVTGTRTPADSEVLIPDITAMVASWHYQTAKRWNGIITYTLTSAGATTYSADFNYGHSSPNQFGGRDFTLTDFRVDYHGNANETGLDFILFHHATGATGTAGWTYSAAAFVPGGTKVVEASAELSTDVKLDSGELGTYERRGLSTFVNGDNGEGYVVQFVTAVNNSLHHVNFRVGATF